MRCLIKSSILEVILGRCTLTATLSPVCKMASCTCPIEAARTAEKHLEWAREYGIGDIVEEFSSSLHQELDYGIEGRNTEKIAKQFLDDPMIQIPKIYWEYSSKKVLTMEFVEGIKINDIATIDELGFNRKLLSERFTDAMLNQILMNGHFHADPHPDQ